MTRRNHELESLILAANSPAEGARAAGVTPARASQVWAAAGRKATTGRPPKPTSTRALQGYGARVVEISTATGYLPAEVLDLAAALPVLVTDRPEADHLGPIDNWIHPLDVGFDPRTTGRRVALGIQDPMHVSYAGPAGERRVVAGPRALVVIRLRAAGYDVEGPP